MYLVAWKIQSMGIYSYYSTSGRQRPKLDGKVTYDVNIGTNVSPACLFKVEKLDI